MSIKFICTLEAASSGGSANPAQVDFDFSYPYLPPVTDAVVAAQLLGYFQACIYACSNVAVTRIQKRPTGSAGNVDVPFPVTAYSALYTAYGSPLTVMTSYGVTFGSGDAAPVGTSYLVAEYTAIPGRSYTGRHYLPFVGAGSIDSNGFVPPANVAAAEGAYRDFFFGDGAGCVDLAPLVVSKKLGTDTPITTPKCSSTPAQLKSRRR